jgi:hypothetical protein
MAFDDMISLVLGKPLLTASIAFLILLCLYMYLFYFDPSLNKTTQEATLQTVEGLWASKRGGKWNL